MFAPVAQGIEHRFPKGKRTQKTPYFLGFLHFLIHQLTLGNPVSGCNRV
jgi:hypothetical protein